MQMNAKPCMLYMESALQSHTYINCLYIFSMKYIIHFLLAFLFLFLFISSTIHEVHGKILPIVDNQGNTTTGAMLQTYIVHVQKPKGTTFLTFEDRRNWYMSFLPNTTLDTGEPRMVYTYRHAINGFAAKLTEDEADAMKGKEGVLLSLPEEECKLRTTYTPRFLGLSGPGGLWINRSITNHGQGQIIGMIDTGVKFSHPSFDDEGMPPPPQGWGNRCYFRNDCNNKIIGAVGYYNGHQVSPSDDDGHGTHTASTAAGNFVTDANVLGHADGTASGTAPKAYLSIYKVEGGDSDALKCIDEAINHRVDVISMSMGVLKPCPLYEDNYAVGAFAAVSNGIVVVQAGGNSGPLPNQVDGAPWIIMVGASTTDRRIEATVKLGDGREFFGESAYHSPFSSKQWPLEWPYGVYKTNEANFCKADVLKKLQIKGKIVLCESNGEENIVVGENVKKEGGVGVIFMSGYLQGYLTTSQPHVLPAVNVALHDTLKILNYFNVTNKPTAALIFGGTIFGVRPTPTVASFSNRGPSLYNGYIIKPDVVAPGVNILAAWPEKVGQSVTTISAAGNKYFNFESGTSMAAPHVSGVVALLKSNHPAWSPAAIRSAIMTTAYTRDLDGNPIKDQLNYNKSDVYTVGSGHINPTAANEPGLIYDIHPNDYIRYLCGSGMHLTDKQVSIIARTPTICSQVHAIDAEQLNYPSISVTLGSSSTRKIITRTVRNVGIQNSEYLVDFDIPAGVNMVVNPKTLKFVRSDEEQNFTVTLSIQGQHSGDISEGQLTWHTNNGKYSVRSPIAVIFT